LSQRTNRHVNALDQPWPRCPRCGGQLQPTTGIHRLLDHRPVCSKCGLLWTPAEAAAGTWRRGDNVPEPIEGRGFLAAIIFHGAIGFLLLLVLGLQWFVVEYAGWCSSSWDYESIQDCISGESSQDARWLHRILVPGLAAAWLAISIALIRARRARYGIMMSSLTWCFVSILLLLFMFS
jgi:hypothetical protein